MELKEKYKALKEIFGCSDGETFSESVMRCVISGNRNVYEEYLSILPDLSHDELRECWQFWSADRKEKKQDYTSDYLASLVGALALPFSKIMDICAGSGSLSINAWNYNHDIKIICEEIDEEVIPLLLFNLAVRNIESVVHCGNVLTGETMRTWEVRKGDRFGDVECLMFPQEDREVCDVVLCNPPFNLRADGKLMNYQFVRMSLQRADRAVFILPSGCFSSDQERTDRAELIREGKFTSVISMPSGFFSATSIPVSVAVFGTGNNGVELISAESLCDTEIRDQRGEGDSSHTERIYHKQVRTISKSQIAAICEMVDRRVTGEVSVFATAEEIECHGYSLKVGQYKLPELDEKNTLHRAYTDIINDINRITRLRNTMKVVCNKVWLSQLGLNDLLSLSEQSKELTKELNRQLSSIGIVIPLESVDYLSSSNSKVLEIRQNDKEILSPVLDTFVRMWGMHIRTMNEMENQYLSELRDALLPALMNGSIKISNENQNP